MKTKLLFTVLLSSIITVISCQYEPVLPNKEPISDPIIKKPVIKKDTAQLPTKSIYGGTNE